MPLTLTFSGPKLTQTITPAILLAVKNLVKSVHSGLLYEYKKYNVFVTLQLSFPFLFFLSKIVLLLDITFKKIKGERGWTTDIL